MAISGERRAHRRYPLASSVNLHHEPSDRKFDARCVDVSRGGMLVYVPASVPVKIGQQVQLRVKQPPTADEFDGVLEEPCHATIVRVDRHQLISIGHVGVGMRFS